MDEELEEDGPLNKRAIAVVAVPLALVVVFLVIFFTVFNDNDEEAPSSAPVDNSVEITETEQLEVEGLAEQFITQAGTFGVKKDAISAENIDEMATLLETDVNSSQYYFTSRAVAYGSLEEFIMTDSPLDYPADTVNNWTNSFETNFRNSFVVNDVKVNAENKGSSITTDEGQLKSAVVNVVFDSNETMFVEVGSEYGAERSYSVRSKDFVGNRASLIFVDTPEGWKLYNIRDLNNEFLLATWDDPAEEAFSDTQFNFEEIDKIVPPDQNVEESVDE